MFDLTPRSEDSFDGRDWRPSPAQTSRRHFLEGLCGAVFASGCHFHNCYPIAVGSPSHLIDQTFRAFQQGLPRNERSRIALQVGRRRVYIGIDLENLGIPSYNLAMLRDIPRIVVDAIVVSVLDSGTKFQALVSVTTDSGDTRLLPFARKFGEEDYVGAVPNGMLGQTLLPSRKPFVPDTLYAPSRCNEIFVAADQSACEIAATVYHELAHLRFGPGHPPAVLQAEDEARRNAQQ